MIPQRQSRAHVRPSDIHISGIGTVGFVKIVVDIARPDPEAGYEDTLAGWVFAETRFDQGLRVLATKP
jgi:hypothetical protein